MTKVELLEKELEKFQGNWMQIGYERDGVRNPVDDEIDWNPRTKFEDYSFEVMNGDGNVLIKGTFTIYPDKKPKAIDYIDTFGEYAGKTFKAIYYFDGDMLVFCAAGHLKKRPSEFKTTYGQVMRTLRREIKSR